MLIATSIPIAIFRGRALPFPAQHFTGRQDPSNHSLFALCSVENAFGISERDQYPWPALSPPGAASSHKVAVVHLHRHLRGTGRTHHLPQRQELGEQSHRRHQCAASHGRCKTPISYTHTTHTAQLLYHLYILNLCQFHFRVCRTCP